VIHKILYLNHVSEVAGAEIVLINLLKNLDPTKFDLTVAYPPNGRLTGKLEEIGIKTEPVKISALRRTFNPMAIISYIYSFVLTTGRLVIIIKRNKINLIHANSFCAQLYGSIPAKITNTPIVWHMHDLIEPQFCNWFFVKWAGITSTRIIAVSNAVARTLLKLGVNAKKIVTIYNGVDLKKFNCENVYKHKIRKELGIELTVPVIGIVGQLASWKGHDNFLKAASIVVKKYPLARFEIIGESITGDTSYKLKLENLVSELKLSDKVIFIGYRKDMPEMMASLDILVNASSAEPFGLVIVEAMALGRPVIAADAGGAPEIIRDGENGFLVLPRDPQELAGAILKILDNPMTGRKMGKLGRRMVKEQFSLEKNVRQIEDIYWEILKRNGAGQNLATELRRSLKRSLFGQIL